MSFSLISCLWTYPSYPNPDRQQRFLLPYVQYGPNNQFMQLMEAAVAAKALGRALLVPSFRAWVQDETGSRGSHVRFQDVWDEDELSRYVQLAHGARRSSLKSHTLITLADYKQKVSLSLSLSLSLRLSLRLSLSLSLSLRLSLTLTLRLSLSLTPTLNLDQAVDEYLKVQQLAASSGRVKKTRLKGAVVDSVDAVERIATDAGVGPKVPLLGWYSFFTVERPQLLEAARFFRRAASIRRQAEQVGDALFGGEPFLAVHLRRESTDLGCARGHPTVLCPRDGGIWTIETPQVLAEIKAVQLSSGLKNVYIATIHPPMVPKYSHELATLLQKVPGAKSASDLPQMASHLGIAAGSLTRWTQSLVEQELCANAHGFLGSERSTWTGNVALEREAHGRGRNQFFGAVAGGGAGGSNRMVELRV